MPGLKSVSFTGPYGAEEAEIERRRRMAEMLQGQAAQPLDAGRQVGGWAIPISPWEGAAKLAQGASAGYQDKRSIEMAKALRDRQQGDRSADMQTLSTMLRGSPATSEQIVDEQANGGMGAPATINAPARPGGVDPGMLGQLRSPWGQGVGDQLLLEQMKPKDPNAMIGKINPKDYTPESFAQFMQTQNPALLRPVQDYATVGGSLVPKPTGAIPQGGIVPVYTAPPKPPSVPSAIQEYQFAKEQGFKGTFEEYQKSLRKAGATNLTVDNRAESAYGQKVAGGAAERDEAQINAARSAAENLHKLDSVINHLKTSKAITGMGSDVLKNIERAKVLFTQSEAAGKRVSDTELLDSMLGSDVFPMIAALGIGARGMDTPAEREFLRSVMTGTTAMNKDTLIRMAEIRRDISKRAIDKYNQRVEKGELDRYFRFSGMPKQKIEVPGAVIPDEPPPGAVRPRR